MCPLRRVCFRLSAERVRIWHHASPLSTYSATTATTARRNIKRAARREPPRHHFGAPPQRPLLPISRAIRLRLFDRPRALGASSPIRATHGGPDTSGPRDLGFCAADGAMGRWRIAAAAPAPPRGSSRAGDGVISGEIRAFVLYACGSSKASRVCYRSELAAIVVGL